MRIKRTLLCLVVAGACAGGYVAVASGDDGVAPSAPAVAPAPADTGLATAFGVFRRAATASDVLPPEARRILATVAAREGLDLDAARAVAPFAGRSVWALRGPDAVCLAIPDPVDGYGISCGDGAQARSGLLRVTLVGLPGQTRGDAVVAVLVPDGVAAATAVGVRGRRAALAVSDNVAFGSVTDSAAVEYGDGAAKRSVPVPGTPAALVAAR